MSLTKTVARFVALFVLIFGLLIFPWPGWNKCYGAAFRSVGNVIFGRHTEVQVLFFEPHVQTQGLSSLDTAIIVGDPRLADSSGKGPVSLLGLDTRSIGWIPTALITALVVATPISSRRRAIALLCGLILIQLFILISIAVDIWSQTAPLSVGWKYFADGLEYTLVQQLGISFTVPVFIWAAVTFRGTDFKQLLTSPRN